MGSQGQGQGSSHDPGSPRTTEHVPGVPLRGSDCVRGGPRDSNVLLGPSFPSRCCAFSGQPWLCPPAPSSSTGSPGCAPVPSQQAALAVTPPAPSSAGSPGCAAHPIVVGREPWLCRPLCRWRQGGLAVPPVPYTLVALPSEAHACGLEPSANTWSWGHRNARPCGSLHGQPLGAGVGKSHFPGA